MVCGHPEQVPGVVQRSIGGQQIRPMNLTSHDEPELLDRKSAKTQVLQRVKSSRSGLSLDPQHKSSGVRSLQKEVFHDAL